MAALVLVMIYCLNPACSRPENPAHNVHCQYCGSKIALRNRFKASRLLGQGGFGKTYLAQDLDNRNKPCVIKRLTYRGPDAQSTEKARQLFEQEAERLDQLIHPQIPRLLAYFQESSYLYLVQEVIEGQTLQDELLEDGPFSEAKIRSLLTGLLPVLKFVHSHSVIHRDIKPDNIMRRCNGELVLIDFGVAKFLEQSGFTQTATTIGTPGYAAPEQIQGTVTPSSDLFGLGATCFQLLTQGFDSGSVSTTGYSWVKNWPKYVQVPLSTELKAILTKLIAIDQRSRYHIADEVLRDLQSGITSAGPTATPPQPPSHSNFKTVAVAPAAPAREPQNTPANQPPHIQPIGSATVQPVQQPQKQSQKQSQKQPQSPPQNPPQNPPPGNRIVQRPVPRPAQSPAQPFLQASFQPSAQYSPPTTVSNSQNLPGQNIPRQNVPAHQAWGQPIYGQQPPNLSTQNVPVSGVFWLQYALITCTSQTLGFITVLFGTVLVSVVGNSNSGDFTPSETEALIEIIYWVYWVATGFVVGLAQWLVLKKWLPKALWWMPATVAGFWVIAVMIATDYVSGFSGFIFGSLVGLPQWLAMRQYAPRAHWWLGWIVLYTTILFISIPLGIKHTASWMTIAPVIDGFLLTWILRKQTIKRSVIR